MSPPAPFTHFTLISRFLRTKWQWFYICIYKNKVREIFTLVVAWEIVGNNSKQLKESFFFNRQTPLQLATTMAKLPSMGLWISRKCSDIHCLWLQRYLPKYNCFILPFFKKTENLQHWKTALEGIRLFTDYPIRFSNQNSTEIKSSTRAK